MLKRTLSMLRIHINPNVIEAQYAVRGLIPMRADEIKSQLADKEAAKKYGFDKLVYCNIGNPQALQQKPLTFYRQVLSLIDAPFNLENPQIVGAYPADVVARAREYLGHIGSATGAYSDSLGYPFARKIVAKSINDRDKNIQPLAEPENICLTDGASSGVKLIMQILIGGSSDAVMLPIPQYPLYSAQLTLLGGSAAPYFLKEKENWGLQSEDLQNVYKASIEKKATPRLLIMINPGNPTGGVLSREVMEGVVRFCCDNNVVLLADEVYQENVYDSKKSFISFREVVLSMPAPYNTDTVLLSLHSTSKGVIGECGRRGGYLLMTNFPKELREQVVKMCSINICSNVNGQITTALMCSPPQKGDASYDLFQSEYQGIFNSLKERANLLARELNKIEGCSCQPVEGAMYAYPSITLPKKYAEHNEEMNKKEGRKLQLDARWALELLEGYGIVVVPGSGFGQEEGTFHFRTTILPPQKEMERVVSSIRKFQEEILKKYK